MQSAVIEVRTGTAETVVDLTADVARFLADAGAVDGLLNVWVPHATAGLAVFETGAGTEADLLAALQDLLPADDRWRHRHGSPGHGRDHVLPALVSPSLTIPVIAGRPALGTWQSICLVDTNTDNPRAAPCACPSSVADAAAPGAESTRRAAGVVAQSESPAAAAPDPQPVHHR